MDAVPDYNKGEDLDLAGRQALFAEIERIRGRRLIAFFNFDRATTPDVPGLGMNFTPDAKGPLFRVLKETADQQRGIDLCLYTRGGDTNAVMPIVGLLREFDPDFEVLVPFRCHSAGTMVALAARQIVMAPMAELSPIDPATGNQFNPTDEKSAKLIGISVEDVKAYRDFVLEQFQFPPQDAGTAAARDCLAPFVQQLADKVHPLALGNVHRVHQQIRKLADRLLAFHIEDQEQRNRVTEALTSKLCSHLHMIGTTEAKEIMGDQVCSAKTELATALDRLLRGYEVHFCLRRNFHLGPFTGEEQRKEARFIAGAIESAEWSYVHETKLTIHQHSTFPPNVQVQIIPGEGLPLVPGLPRAYRIELASQGWVRNTEPKGFDR